MHLCQVANARAHYCLTHRPRTISSLSNLRPHLQISTQRAEQREEESEVIAGMNCIKILLLVSLIPLALRGASLLGDVVVPSPSPDSASATTGLLAPVAQVEQWRRQRRRIAGQSGRATVAFAPRRFGGAGGFFRDDKRFAPTGSNPLHNL